MKCLHFDCFAGISGDMLLGALVDLGVPQKYLKEELKKVGVSGYMIRISREERSGIAGRRAHVKIAAGKDRHHRSFADIEKIIAKSALTPPVKDKSREIFYHLAQAEAHIHNRTVPEIHFHEVGALDSIVDIVGSVIGIDYLDVDHFSASSVPLGSGFVNCRHGTLPVPAPATLKLLEGVPVYDSGIRSELVTPTGAALLTGYATQFGAMPAMTVTRSGYGAGSRDFGDFPNMLRLVTGGIHTAGNDESMLVLEATIDDMNPEWTGYLMERLFEDGARDVVVIPVYMKKNRPGILLQVVCPDRKRQVLTRTIFAESTTAGIRAYRVARTVLPRKKKRLKTAFGMVTVKVFHDEGGENIAPEFEECKKIARKKNVALKEVYRAIAAAAGVKKSG